MVANTADVLEQALLGALHINPALLDSPDVRRLAECDFGLRRNWLWLEGLRETWGETLHEGLAVIDDALLAGVMGDVFQEAGGYPFLAQIDLTCDNSLLAPVYARTILKAAIQRQKMKLTGELASAVAHGDNEKATEKRRALDSADDRLTTGECSWTGLVAEAESRHELWQGTPAEIRGWKTDIPRLDRNLGGINQGLVSIYGATSMGKSTLTRQWALAFARQGAAVVYVPTEMGPAEVIDNLVGEMCGIPFKRVRSGYVSEDEREAMYEARRELADLQIIPLDHPSPTPQAVEQFVHARMREKRCNVLVVDSGSNLSVPDGQGQIFNEMRIAAGMLKDIAYNYQIPVIASWQIGRADKDRSPVPRIGDAKGASDIEYNSHIVMAIFRPYYYISRKQVVPEQYREAQPNDAFIFVLKDRSGGAGDDVVPVRFIMGQGFRELTQDLPGNGNGRSAAVAAVGRYGKDGE